MTGTVPCDATVEQLRATAYTIPTDAPEGDGTTTWNSTTMVLVEAVADGVTGLGWTYGPAPCAGLVEGLLAGAVVGERVGDLRRLWEQMVRTARNATTVGSVGYALSAVDVALWDLKARLLGLSLADLLGRAREQVAVYGSGGFTTYSPQQQHDQLTHWTVEQMIPRVKIKIGESWGSRVDRDIDRIRVARETIGPQTELYVDANGGYTAKQAVRVMERVAEVDPRWLEEPVSSDDLEGLAAVRGRVAPDVAAGEYGTDEFYFRRMLDAHAVDCLQIDATRCGGYTTWLRAAALAQARCLQVSGHCAPNLHAHVAAATTNFRHIEWFHDHVRIEGMLFDGTLDPTGGVVVPDVHVLGHGLEFRRDVAEQFRAEAA